MSLYSSRRIDIKRYGWIILVVLSIIILLFSYVTSIPVNLYVTNPVLESGKSSLLWVVVKNNSPVSKKLLVTPHSYTLEVNSAPEEIIIPPYGEVSYSILVSSSTGYTGDHLIRFFVVDGSRTYVYYIKVRVV